MTWWIFHIFWLGIEQCHRHLPAGQGPSLDARYDFISYGWKLRQLVEGKMPQDKAYLATFIEIVPDAHAYARVLPGFQKIFDIAESVMAAVTAVHSHADGSEREIDVVADDDEVFQWNVQLGQPVAYGITAEVHVRRWLEQVEGTPLDAFGGHGAITFVFKRNIGRLSPGVQYHESDVMSGGGVLCANVAETDYQISLVRHA